MLQKNRTLNVWAKLAFCGLALSLSLSSVTHIANAKPETNVANINLYEHDRTVIAAAPLGDPVRNRVSENRNLLHNNQEATRRFVNPGDIINVDVVGERALSTFQHEIANKMLTTKSVNEVIKDFDTVMDLTDEV